MNKNKQVILVTGASGYIGSQIVHMLQKKYGGEAHIRALVRESSDVSILSGLPVEIMQGDITDPVSLQEPFDSVDVDRKSVV